MKLPGWPNARSGCLTRFLRSASGSIIVPFAVASPVLLGISALAIDYATLSMKVGELQAVADSSALGGANELALAGSSDEAIKAVVASYVAMEFSGSGSIVTSTADINRKAGTLRVALEETWTPIFAKLINADVTPIRVDATATVLGSDNVCVLALNDSASATVHLDQNASLEANGCGVYSNSTHSQGIRLDSASTIHASSICSVGGYKASTTSIDPLPTTDCPPVPDPLVGRTPPVAGGCDVTDFKISSGNKILDPGTYCGGLNITKTASVTFAPGIYIIKDGEFKVANNASISGEHVGFYLLGNASKINFLDDSSVNLTGALNGDMAGLLFFEDRSAPLNRQHHIQSTHADVLTGTIYLSRGVLAIDPNSKVAQDSAYTAIIARRFELTQGLQLILNSDYGATDVPVPAGIRSSSQVVLSE
jgi:Flp pilus assembly protein TadG